MPKVITVPTVTTSATCPECAEVLQFNKPQSAQPRAGSITTCIGCGKLLEFTALRDANGDRLLKLATQKRLDGLSEQAKLELTENYEFIKGAKESPN